MDIEQTIRIRKAFENEDEKEEFKERESGIESLERGEEVDQADVFENINIDNSKKIDANELYELNDGLEWDPF